MKVSEWVQDHAKQTILSDWANGEHKAKNTKIKVHLPPQRLNRFVNGFVERVRGVCRYLNVPKSMQNEVLLIENYYCVCMPAQWKLCAPKWRTSLAGILHSFGMPASEIMWSILSPQTSSQASHIPSSQYLSLLVLQKSWLIYLVHGNRAINLYGYHLDLGEILLNHSIWTNKS